MADENDRAPDAAQAPARADRRAERLIERMGDAHCVLDRDFCIRSVNAATERLLGVPRAALVGRSHWDVFPASVDAPVGRAFRRVVAEGVDQHLIHHYTGEGYDLHLELDAYPTDEGGVAMFWRDVTARVRAEEALRASEERFRALATVGSSLVYRMSPDWREMRRLDGAGFLADTLEPTTGWLDTYIPPDERPRVREAIERAIAAKDVFQLEHRVLRADGKVGWVFSRAIPLFDEAGEITGWFGAATDVTARVKADQSFTRLFRASPAPFLVLKPDSPRFTIAEVNDAYLAATMRTREALVGRGIFEAFLDNPADATIAGVSTLRASLERVLASHQPDRLPGLKFDVARPDGTFEERWWSPVNSAVLDENGAVEAIIHNANDVTEEHRAEAALRASEERLQLALEAAGLGAYVWQPGDDREPLGGQPFSPAVVLGELIHPDDQQGYQAAVARALDPAGGGELREEVRSVAPDGEVRWLAITGRTEFAASPRRAVRMLGVVADVTDRHGAEKALRESEARLQLALDAAQMGTFVWYPEGDRGDTDARTLALYGLEPDSALNHTRGLGELVVPADRAAHAAKVARALDPAGDGVLRSEYRIRRARDGAERWIATLAQTQFAGEPQVAVSITGVCADVTANKQAEAALRESKERQAFLLALSDALRPLTDAATVVATACRLLGKRLGADRAYYVEMDESAGVTRVRADYLRGDSPSLVGEYRVADFGWVIPPMRRGEMLVIQDVTTSPLVPAADLPAMAAVRIGAHVNAPLVKGGALVGGLCVTEPDPREWTPAEVELVRDVGERLWGAIERVKAEGALRRANDELEERVKARTAELATALDTLEAEMARRRDIARQLSTAQEDERLRISRDLHDTVGQLMAGLSLAFKAVERSGDLPLPTAAKLAEAQQVANAIGKEVHALAVRLRPTALDDIGLEAALGQLVAEWSARAVVAADFQAVGLGRLSREIETTVYRVVQEALTNAAKHARASQVSVTVTRSPGHVTAAVEDDGTGFDPGAAPQERLGLVGMRERAALVGGEVEIESSVGGGTTVLVRIPVPEGRGP